MDALIATFCASYDPMCVATSLSAAYGDCVAEVTAMAVGTEGDTSGNTFACRSYHLQAALADAATHCPHAAADGGGVCVD